MKKKATANTNLDALLNARNERLIDILAGGYLKCLAEIEDRKQQLLRVCRKEGFTPKDAPKTKMLVGELYEVLASRATRTDVNQVRAQNLKYWLHTKKCDAVFMGLFETRMVLNVLRGAHRFLAAGGLPRGLRERFERCLLRSSSRRLTVRKKKVAGGRVQGTGKRKAA